jgi:hypothetical protein
VPSLLTSRMFEREMKAFEGEVRWAMKRRRTGEKEGRSGTRNYRD